MEKIIRHLLILFAKPPAHGVRRCFAASVLLIDETGVFLFLKEYVNITRVRCPGKCTHRLVCVIFRIKRSAFLVQDSTDNFPPLAGIKVRKPNV